MPNEVILLVGGNPLPNYVAARALRCTHGIDKAHLLYTEEVEEEKNNLLKCLSHDGFSFSEPSIIDAGDASEISRACENICGDSHLHYTGGTNTMAVHVHKKWMCRGGQPDRASYLFAKTDQLIFDDGTKKKIPSSIQLDLKTLADLHGLTDAAPSSSSYTMDPQVPNDANVIAESVFCNPNLAKTMYEKVERPKLKNNEVKTQSDGDFNKNPVYPSKDWGLILSQTDPIPHSCWTTNQGKSWRKFLRGEWLEEWVYQKIKDIKWPKGINPPYLYVGIKPKIKGREFELDVVAIRGHHLYVVSCTTDTTSYLCKSKLFEVAMRARRLGGDLARSALVCLAKRSVVDNLQKDVDSLSESSSRTPRVFGLDSVNGWMGGRRSDPNLTSLCNWLTDR